MAKEILLLGEFSTGKSAFINLLLGVSILPERLEATDMPVIKIWQSKPTGLFLREKGQKNPLPLDYFSEIPKNWDTFDYAEISIKGHPLLDQGLIIWDTPGINSSNPNHQKHLEKFLQNSMRGFAMVIFLDRGNLTSTKIEFLKKFSFLHNKLRFIINLHENISKENSILILKEAKSVISKYGFNNDVSLLKIGDLVDAFYLESEKMREGISDWDLIKEWGKRKIDYKKLLNSLPNIEDSGLIIFDDITKIASKQIKNLDYYFNLDNKILLNLAKNNDDQAIYVHALKNLKAGDFKNYIRLLKYSANLGNSNAQYELAVFYKDGFDFFREDQNLYSHYLNLAIQNNNSKAVAHSYLDGFNRPKDPMMGFSILRNEFEKGNLVVAYELAELYKDGTGTSKNMEEAERLLRSYQNYNTILGETLLGSFLLEMDNVSKKKEGFSILNSLIKKETNFLAAISLSKTYIEGNNELGIKTNPNKAYEILKPYTGDKYLCDFFISKIFLGYPDLRKEKEGFKLLTSLYKENPEDFIKDIIIELALCYYHGIGTDEDKFKAYELFEKAAQDSIPESYYYLGLFYKEGTYVEKNLLLAKSYFEKAIELGIKEAINELSELTEYFKNTPYARWRKLDEDSYYFEIMGEDVTEKTEAKSIWDNHLIVFYNEKNYNYICYNFENSEKNKFFEAEYLGEGNLAFYSKNDDFWQLIDLQDEINLDELEDYFIEDYNDDDEDIIDCIIFDPKNFNNYIVPDYNNLENNKVYPIYKFCLKWKKEKNNHFRLLINDENISDRINDKFSKGDDLICEVSDFKYKVKLKNFLNAKANVWHPAIFVDEEKGFWDLIEDLFN